MKTLGILGGMGAEATSLFYQTLIQQTPASSDQQHIPTIMINPTTLPDRGPIILSGKLDDFGQQLLTVATQLQKAGADYIVMPCNTVHVFLPYLTPLDIPVIDMIQETVQYLQTQSIQTVGILGTNATIQSRLYQTKLDHCQIQSVTPHLIYQDMVMEAIFDVKAGKSKDIARTKLQMVIDHLKDLHVDSIILGCTELPLLVSDIPHITLCDPLQILAERCVQYSLGKIALPEKACHIRV